MWYSLFKTLVIQKLILFSVINKTGNLFVLFLLFIDIFCTCYSLFDFIVVLKVCIVYIKPVSLFCSDCLTIFNYFFALKTELTLDMEEDVKKTSFRGISPIEGQQFDCFFSTCISIHKIVFTCTYSCNYTFTGGNSLPSDRENIH